MVFNSPPIFNMENAIKGEAAAIQSFNKDQYGCNDPALYSKRDKRNPFKRTVPYTLACPEISELLQWCGPENYNVDKLPWNKVLSLSPQPIAADGGAP